MTDREEKKVEAARKRIGQKRRKLKAAGVVRAQRALDEAMTASGDEGVVSRKRQIRALARMKRGGTSSKGE